MLSSLDVSTSALVAQRTRMNAISSNLANMSSVRDENGNVKPYQSRFVVFQTDDSTQNKFGAVGVKVGSVETENVEPRYRYQPSHPLAVKEGKWQGYVAYPNVNMTQEFTDALEATRAYEANVGAIEITKSMGQQTLRILG